MSSLLAVTEPKGVVVVTDTLAVIGGKPHKFTTKTQILPHLNLIITGTGVGGFADQWALHINTELNILDIDGLAEVAHINLARLWAACSKKFSIQRGRTATLYHFGFSRETGVIHTFVARSEEGFKVEWCGYGVISRPPIDIPYGHTLPKDAKAIMDEQRRYQESLPANQRVYIGGAIQSHCLYEGGFQISTIATFADYEEQHRQMLGESSI